ncbi:MAG: NAD(P)-binding protein, partial [Prosthecobacter sp.]|nr:NAD(P)-binding protein [Prosthecobacter sp.]
MSLPRLAIIGTGISGLGCAHFLHKRFDLTLYEAGDYVGGPGKPALSVCGEWSRPSKG